MNGLPSLHAVVRTDSDESYWAEVEDLPGCFASGFSLPEVVEALKEAVLVYLDGEVVSLTIGGAL